MIFLVLTSVWCGLAEGFPSLLAARAMQGFSSGPVYTFAPEITGDIFFHHERGRAMVAYTMRHCTELPKGTWAALGSLGQVAQVAKQSPKEAYICAVRRQWRSIVLQKLSQVTGTSK